MEAGRWSQQRGLAVALGVLVTVVALDVMLGPQIVISGSYALAVVVASAVTSVRLTAVLAVAAVLLSALSGFWNDNFGTLDWEVRWVLTVVLATMGLWSARIRADRERDLHDMTEIAETAQRAVLRNMPSAIGSVGFAARYLSATRAALVGGDLYEVAESPYGVRVIVGDVRGKGLDAVQMAGTVLGAFRLAALTEPSLSAVATDLDTVVATVAGEEDFVTAVLAEFHDDHTVSVVNCGHHAPLVAGADAADDLDSGDPALPLGLGSRPGCVTVRWPETSRLLIYTDGLVEARGARGAFFPLADHASALCEGTLEEALGRLVSELVDFAGEEVHDDMALVLVEQRPH